MERSVCLLLLLLPLQSTVGFSLLSNFLPFHPFLTQLSPPSYSHYLYVFFCVLNPSFPWSSSVSPTCWFPLQYSFRYPFSFHPHHVTQPRHSFAFYKSHYTVKCRCNERQYNEMFRIAKLCLGPFPFPYLMCVKTFHFNEFRTFSITN